MPSDDCFTFADTDGMLELTADLGDPVRQAAYLKRFRAITGAIRPLRKNHP